MTRHAGEDEATGRHPSVDFNHHFTPDGITPEEAYRELRAKCPVAWSEHHGGYWIVAKHQYATQVFKDPETFRSSRDPETPELGNLSIPKSPFKPMIPEELQPPEFLAYRRLMNGILSMKIIRDGGLAERLNFWVDWHIDQFIERGSGDFVYDLTNPVMGAVALGWLGFPREDWDRISAAFHDAVGYPPDSERAQQAFVDIGEYQERRISEEIALRQEELRQGKSRDDVMAYLVAQEIDGAPLRTEMAEGMVRVLIAGGVDTTATTTTSALVHLHKHPEHRRQLRENPDLWETAVEEFLRRYPPVLGHGRTVAKDTELGGCALREGDKVLVSEASSCWDEDEFPRADEVILDRFPNRHLAFGLGPHRCPGMHLARMGIRRMVSQVLERMPDYRIDDSALLRNANLAGMAGWRAVPATFTPGERVLAPGAEDRYVASAKETP